MKRRILSPAGITLTVALFASWLTLVQLRESLITPWCPAAPAQCRAEQLWAIDRIGFGGEDWRWDHLSFITQNLSGVIAISGPILLQSVRLASGALPAAGAATLLAEDLLIVLQSVALTGALKELTHDLTQRPRPFVYLDPVHRGDEPAHYTSFFSGHTSFAASALSATVFMAAARGLPLAIVNTGWIISGIITLLTAIGRILAGRHFPTDVATASVVGFLCAWGVAKFWRKNYRVGSR